MYDDVVFKLEPILIFIMDVIGKKMCVNLNKSDFHMRDSG